MTGGVSELFREELRNFIQPLFMFVCRRLCSCSLLF